MSKQQGQELPNGWVKADLSLVGSLLCGQSPSSSTVNTEGRGVLYVSGPEHWDGIKVHVNKWTTSPAKTVPDGAVFVTVKGAGVGTVFPGIAAAIGRDIYAFLPDEGISRDFITYVLKFTVANVVRKAQGDIPGLSKGHLLNHDIPLPPSAEQGRIVDAIDELSTDLDAGKEALERARHKSSQYRSAVLKAAVEGRLSEDWREQNPDTEPASELLIRILAERRRLWEEKQLRRFEEKGRVPPKDWKRGYKEPASPNESMLPPLPAGWCWATVEQVGAVQLGRQRAPQHHRGDFMRPYLRVANVYEDRIDLSSVLEMNFSPEEFETYRLQENDILLNEGQSLEFVGRPAMYRGELPGACFQNTLVRFKAVDGLLPYYALTYFRACLRNHRFRKLSRWTVNIAHLGAERFAKMEFPLPPTDEQEVIIQAVEEQLSVIDHLEKDLGKALESALALERSILRHAFTGQLVDQDPSEQSASELLEQISKRRQQRGSPTLRKTKSGESA